MRAKTLVIGLLTVVCGLLVSGCNCPTGSVKFKHEGDVIVLGSGDAGLVTLWRSYEGNQCKSKPVVGAISSGTQGKWLQVERNSSEDLMIRVYVEEFESSEKQVGWIDCRYVKIITPLEDELSSKGEDVGECWRVGSSK